MPPVADPVKASLSGALPVVGVPEAVALSGEPPPLIHRSDRGSPSAAWSAVVMGKVESPRLSLGSMIPGWTFCSTRSIAAITLLVV